MPAETSARQQGDAALQGQIDEINERPDPVTDLSNYYTKPETYSQTQVDNLINNIDTGGDVNLDDYTKDEIDNQFTLRGVGYTYLMSSFNGTATIRLVNYTQITGWQVGYIHQFGNRRDNGKQRRSPVEGDTIELYDNLTGKFYRYLINGVADLLMELRSKLPMKIVMIRSEWDIHSSYLYPTHISSANYYDKTASDDRFMSKKPGAMETCSAAITSKLPVNTLA